MRIYLHSLAFAGVMLSSACDALYFARGRVVDAAGMPIPTARVILISTCFLTDSLGAFDASAIDSPLRRHLDVRAESPGYLPYRQRF
jgi:hypothetical protein